MPKINNHYGELTFKYFFNIFVEKICIKNINTVIPCTGMHASKLKLLGNRCTIKQAFSYIFIRIQVGCTVP